MFFIRTRRELRARGFAVAMVLFEPRHVRSGQLISRIDKHHFDAVLWYRPDTSVRDILAHLKDRGMYVIGIGDGGSPTVRCRYEIRRETAIKAILRDWQARGIKSVVITRGARSTTAEEETLQALLENENLDFQFQSIDSARPDFFVEALISSGNKGVFLPSHVASLVAFRAPEALMKLMRHCRVALSGGPPGIPFAPVLDVPVDLVLVDWQLIAEQIVTDLISKKAFDPAQITVFEAQARIQTSLNQHAQSL